MYAFDPRRVALLVLGGDKTGEDRWCERNVPLADRIYDEHLRDWNGSKRMPKTHKWSELESRMSPAVRAEIKQLVKEELAKMPLQELRAARHFTQQQLAKTLNMSQAAVSQMEQRTDLYLSTLRNFIEAMGAELEIRAVFADGKVELTFEQEQ